MRLVRCGAESYAPASLGRSFAEGGGTINVIKGSVTVLVGECGKAQPDPEGALRRLAAAVLPRI